MQYAGVWLLLKECLVSLEGGGKWMYMGCGFDGLACSPQPKGTWTCV